MSEVALVPLQSFSTGAEGAMVRELLFKNGIRCFVEGDESALIPGIFSQEVVVIVAERDRARAMEIYEAYLDCSQPAATTEDGAISPSTIETKKPRMIGLAMTAWRDAFSATSRMPVVTGIAFVILAVLDVATLPLMPNYANTRHDNGWSLMTIGIGIVQSFVLTPLAIAVHRFVLLGEIGASYALAPSNPRFFRFFRSVVGIHLIRAAPSLLASGTLSELSAEDPPASVWVMSLVFVALTIVVTVVCLRRLIVFPAIAVDAQGATWSNAEQDTKGHSWSVLFIVIFTALPAIGVSLVLLPLCWPPELTFTGSVICVLIYAVIHVLTLSAFAAMASHLYRAFANSLGRPAGTAGPAVAAG